MKAIINFSNCKPAIKELFLTNNLTLPVEIDKDNKKAIIIESECNPLFINNRRHYKNRSTRKHLVKRFNDFFKPYKYAWKVKEIKTNGLSASETNSIMNFNIYNLPAGATLTMVNRHD